MFLVRVKPDFRWAEAYVGGRCFTKQPVGVQEGNLTEEMRNSPLLEVVETVSIESPQDSIVKSSENYDDLHVAAADQDGVAQQGLPAMEKPKRRKKAATAATTLAWKVASDDADG
jgi:hypothetical protein